MNTGLNLHAITRVALSSLHPEETVWLYRSIGRGNQNGRLAPRYAEPEAITAQIQSMSDEALYHAGQAGDNDVSKRCYLFAGEGAARASALLRPVARGGDLIRRGTGPEQAPHKTRQNKGENNTGEPEDTGNDTWWLIAAVQEDFSRSGWLCARITLQVNGPEGGQSAQPRAASLSWPPEAHAS